MSPRVLTIIRHHPAEGPGRIADWAARRGWALDVHAGDARLPTRIGDALLLLGGPQSVAAPSPALQAELDWLRAVLARAPARPVLGLCLGAQLLARALGAAVAPMGFEELGWTRVEVAHEGAWQALDVLQWHEDGFELPPGAQPLARGARWAAQGFRHGAHVGLQFHPEWDEATLARMRDTHGGLPFAVEAGDARHNAVRGWLDARLDEWLRHAPAR